MYWPVEYVEGHPAVVVGDGGAALESLTQEEIVSLPKPFTAE